MEDGNAQSTFRLCHTDLRPLEINHGDEIFLYQRSVSTLSGTPVSTLSFVSPGLVTIPHHYEGHGLQAALKINMPSRDRRVRVSSILPRRHSIFSPGTLAGRMERIRVSSPAASGMKIFGTQHRTIAEESREILIRGINRSELARLSSALTQRNSALISNGLPTFIPDTSPRSTQDQLREWGHAYLGNTATADITVKAVHLRTAGEVTLSNSEGELEKKKMSVERSDSTDNSVLISNMRNITVRAKIVPGTRHRKPFLIQRHFNLDEMQASLPKMCVDKAAVIFAASAERIQHSTLNKTTQSALRKSRGSTVTQPSKLVEGSRTENLWHAKAPSCNAFQTKSRRSMPIHMEYALFYLPVLAALMVSGHVRKGDAVDLPLPHPDAWCDVISHIYTGDGLVTSAMKENILYLGGRVD